MQKRHMVLTISEAFHLFKLDFPEIPVGKTLFYQLRPQHVKLLSQLPHNVCVCMYHANFVYLVEAIQKICPAVPNDLMSLLVCNAASEECITNSCPSCNLETGFQTLVGEWDSELSDEQRHEEVRYEQWMANEKRIGHANFTQLTLMLQEKIVPFALHSFVKRQQSAGFRADRERPGVMVLQMDFSENYTIKFQDEIQTMHWVNEQLSVFTCVSWGNCVQSFAIVTDDLKHDKGAVLVFLDKILEEACALSEEYTELIFYTDGAAGQFKNKFIMKAMQNLAKKVSKLVKWEFFATSHGKGAVDGIGGEVKRIVWDAVRSRKAMVRSVDDFVDCCVAHTTKIKVKIVITNACIT
jgi:hypothetical protein